MNNEQQDCDHSDASISIGDGVRTNELNLENKINNLSSDHQTKFTFRSIEEAFEEVNGVEEKDEDEWLDEFEDQSQMFQWNDLVKTIYARRLMSGTANPFVNSELSPRAWLQSKIGLQSEFETRIHAGFGTIDSHRNAFSAILIKSLLFLNFSSTR